MPMKQDAQGRRWVEMEVLVPGTPEQVWHAVATTAGNRAWFTKATIDGRVGGVIRFDFGAEGSSAGEVTEWQPPHRFGYVERDWMPGAPPVATEITITARGGNRSIMRMVHSLFASTDDWDGQLENFESGWPGFFVVLGLYLTHFAGQKAAPFQVMSSVEGEHLEIWRTLTAALDLTTAAAGARWSPASAPEPLSGIIEHIQQNQTMRLIVVRIDTPSPRIAMIGTYAAGGRINASVTQYIYGDDAESAVAASEAQWRAWMDSVFPRDASAAKIK